jgi:hypothetical protein
MQKTNLKKWDERKWNKFIWFGKGNIVECLFKNSTLISPFSPPEVS